VSISLFSAFVSSGPSGPAVNTGVISSNEQVRAGGATCHAHVKCDSDGSWYESSKTGAYSGAEGAWLTSGLNSEVWIERTVVTGSLTHDAGTGRLVCSTTREFGVDEPDGASAKTCTLYFEFWDAASAGNLLGTSSTITLSAEKP
jgi:hypothetical protein